jgi:uroporphyrinogen decarboxylase
MALPTQTRRHFLTTTTAILAAPGLLTAQGAPAAARLTPRRRVDRVLAGQDVDRPPISLWHHFGLEKEGPARHAAATLAFHRDYRTDLVKVMSDFPFPKPAGAWHDVRPLDDPFPLQIQALTAIRDGLQRSAHFVETIFNPWNVAEKLSSPEAVRALKAEQPQRLLDALEAIAKSEAAHARRAMNAGASGIFLAIANAQPQILSREDYATFSAPFDRIVLEAVKDAPLNVLHLHGDAVYLDAFYAGWPAAVINYSTHGTKVGIDAVRARYPGVIAGGIDETAYRTLDAATLRAQADAARTRAGVRFILTPGCSVPNESQPAELHKLHQLVDA